MSPQLDMSKPDSQCDAICDGDLGSYLGSDEVMRIGFLYRISVHKIRRETSALFLLRLARRIQ